MIRYGNAFFLSLVLHSALLFGVWYFYHTRSNPKEQTPPKLALKISMIAPSLQPTIQEPLKEEICTLPPVKNEPTNEPKQKPQEKKRVPHKEMPIPKKEQRKEMQPAPATSEVVAEKVQPDEPQPKQNRATEPLQERAVEEPLPEPPPVQKPYEEEYRELNKAEIVALLQEHLHYPRSARQKGITGVVKVRFTLHTDASVDAIEVLASSHEILSRAAVKTIEDLSTLFPKPTKQTVLVIPIHYTLTSE